MSANEDSVYSSESAFADSISVRKTSTTQSKLRSMPYLATKRLFDIFVGILGCVLLIPVACIVKIIYLAYGDKHPIFFTQKRIGKGGKERSAQTAALRRNKNRKQKNQRLYKYLRRNLL